MPINKAVGIDLGTTNSCVGVMNDTDSEVVLYRDRNGVRTTPSCVWYDAKKNLIVVGKRAFSKRGSAPPPVVSIKRCMGSTLLTALGTRAQLPDNLPDPLRKVLNETRDERLERFLGRIHDDDPAKQEEKRAQARKNPPLLWVLDQDKRLEEFLSTIKDPKRREALQAEPPLLWLPEEVSALILAEECRLIHETLNANEEGKSYDVDRAVVTVPAYFGATQMEATREASGLAGLGIQELLQEPTAAAIYYTWKQNLQDGVFLVFDLGGGTFDVSIIRKVMGEYEVPGIAGNNFVGGDDMDRMLAEWIRKCLQLEAAEEDEEYNFDFDPNDFDDELLLDNFVKLAEGAKKRLSLEHNMILRDSQIKDKNKRSVNVELEIERSMFSGMLRPWLIEKCIPKCYEALAKAKLRANISLCDVDAIFLVGGSTHVPVVLETVQEFLCQKDGADPLSDELVAAILDEVRGDDKPHTDRLAAEVKQMIRNGERAKCGEPLRDEPDLCVACGAAIQAGFHGIRLGSSEESSVSITILGAKGTPRENTPIKGQVVRRNGESCGGLVVRLSCRNQEVDDEADVDDDGYFVFKKVPLVPESKNLFDVTVHGLGGEQIGAADVTIEHSSSIPEPSTGGSRPTLSKAIKLEISKAGQRTKILKVILESGADLPAEEQYVFKVPARNEGIIVFPIYQGENELKKIRAVIDPTLPGGTPINFRISMSEDFLMRCQYQVGDGDLESAIVEPPPPVKPPTAEQVEAEMAQIESELTYKTPKEMVIFRHRSNRIQQTIETARHGGDEPKMISAFEDLQALKREVIRSADNLEPPWENVQKSVSDCRALVKEIRNSKPEYDADSAVRSLQVYHDAAAKAFNESEQEEYTEHTERIERFRESLVREFQSLDESGARLAGGGSERDPVAEARREVSTLSRVCTQFYSASSQFAEQLAERAENPPEDHDRGIYDNARGQCEKCAKDMAECSAELERLESLCVESPDEVMSRCQGVRVMLSRWQNFLQGMPDLIAGKVRGATVEE